MLSSRTTVAGFEKQKTKPQIHFPISIFGTLAAVTILTPEISWPLRMMIAVLVGGLIWVLWDMFEFMRKKDDEDNS